MPDELGKYQEYMSMLNWSPSLRQRMKHDLSETPLPSDALPDAPAFAVDEANSKILELWEAYPLKDDETCIEHYEKIVESYIDELPSPSAVWDEFHRFSFDLMQQNGIYKPRLPCVATPDDFKEWSIRLTPGFVVEAERALAIIMRELIEQLPPVAFHEPKRAAINVALYEHMGEPKFLASWLFQRTYNLQASGISIFAATAVDLYQRIISASGFTLDTYNVSKNKLTFAVDADGPALSVLQRYLPTDGHLLQLLSKSVPLRLSGEILAKHGVLIAPPGHGKTQLLSSFIAERLHDEQTGMLVLDPHGDLFTSLKPKVPADRLIVLDPSTDPPPLNVFDFGTANDAQVVQAFSYLMSALTGGMSEKQAAVLPYLLKLIRIMPEATVATLLEIVTDRSKDPPFLAHVRKLPDLDRNFFINQFVGKMQETKDAIAWKLSAALSYDAFRTMFATPRNSFDASKAMEDSKIVLVKGSESVLGEFGLPVFLQFIVSQFFLAALKRDTVPHDKRRLFLIFADEASHIFNSQTTRILTECRKYRMGFIAATQVIQQIPQDVKAAIYGATAIKIAGPVSHTDAMLLAREMLTTPEQIRSLRSYERSHAEWMMHVANITERPVKVSVAFGAIDALENAPLIIPALSTEAPPPPPPRPPPPPKFKIGDWVNVELSGTMMFPQAVRITDIQSLQGEVYVFVEGSQSAVPASSLRAADPPKQSPPKPDLGMREPD